MSTSTLEIARDIVLAYIEKYPTGTSGYSANAESAMQRMRSDILGFLREVHTELNALEAGGPLPPTDAPLDEPE
jgi:hypothetical protein